MVAALAMNPIVDWSAGDRDQDRERVYAGLVQHIALGDESALAELYDRTNRIAYGLALRIVRDASSAEEIILDAYLQVWRTAGTYDSARGTVSSWLITLVRSRAIDWLRSRRTRAASMEQGLDDGFDFRDSHPSPEHMAVEAARTRMVQNAMDELPLDQRQAIELAYFSGLSHTEIAVRSGLPLGTVKTRIRLGMLRLREFLRPNAEGL
jgi:RNA polymerase sigma-70 factor, ECF subfamily